jgi:hypothetical protein
MSMVALASMSSRLHCLSSIYRDPQQDLHDAETLLSLPPSSPLTAEPLHNNDSLTFSSSVVRCPWLIVELLCTIYPLICFNPLLIHCNRLPTTIFALPVPRMVENHWHANLDGQVYLPHSHKWRPHTHDLSELAFWMSSHFGSDPPCYAYNPFDWLKVPSQQPILKLSPVLNRNDEMQWSAIEKETNELNLASEAAARKAGTEEACVEKEKEWKQCTMNKYLVKSHGFKSKAQFRIRQLYSTNRKLN